MRTHVPNFAHLETPILNLRRVAHLLAGAVEKACDELARGKRPAPLDVEDMHFLADQALERASTLEEMFYAAHNAAAN